MTLFLDLIFLVFFIVTFITIVLFLSNIRNVILEFGKIISMRFRKVSINGESSIIGAKMVTELKDLWRFYFGICRRFGLLLMERLSRSCSI